MKQLNENELLNESNFYQNLNALYLSPSSLKMLLDTPSKYYEYYVLGNKDKKSAKHFDEGSLIHALVLEPETVQDKFVNIGITVPNESIKSCIDHLLSLERNASELEEYNEEIVAYLKEINLHQSLVDDKKAPWKTGDEKRIEKIITPAAIEYFSIMFNARDKVIVDSQMWDKCQEKANAVLENSFTQFLLKDTSAETELRTELELNLSFSDSEIDCKYGIKGILDIIKIDKINKRIYISDLKTTSGSLKDFENIVEKYSYWTQGAAYSLLAKSLRSGAAFDYTVEVSFIVVDGNNLVYPFTVKEETLIEWEDKLIELINTEVDYHISNKDFTLPYAFANNLITL